MNKSQLEQIKAIKAEIKYLTRKIENWPQGIVSDFAYSYPNGRKKVISLVGYADCTNYKRLLLRKQEALVTRLCEMETYLDSVENEDIRMIMRLRYIEGMSYRKIGKVLGYEESTVRKRLDRYFDNS